MRRSRSGDRPTLCGSTSRRPPVSSSGSLGLSAAVRSSCRTPLSAFYLLHRSAKHLADRTPGGGAQGSLLLSHGRRAGEGGEGEGEGEHSPGCSGLRPSSRQCAARMARACRDGCASEPCARGERHPGGHLCQDGMSAPAHGVVESVGGAETTGAPAVAWTTPPRSLSRNRSKLGDGKPPSCCKRISSC